MEGKVGEGYGGGGGRVFVSMGGRLLMLWASRVGAYSNEYGIYCFQYSAVMYFFLRWMT